jgi:hypothetical protein
MTTMRYFHVGTTIRFIANAMRGNRFRPEEMSDYMLRDIGFIDGRPPVAENGFTAADARSRSFDRLAVTPYAS